MLVLEILRIWMFVFEHKFDRDVIVNLNDLDTNVITLCLWVSFCSCLSKILLNVEWEIMIWFDLIHDSCIHIMFIFFSRSYSRHDIIVFVDLAQLCCKNLIFWVIVLLIKSRDDYSFLIWFWLLENARNFNCLLRVLCHSLHISMKCENMISSICIFNTYAFAYHDSLHIICILHLFLCRCLSNVRVSDIYDIDRFDCSKILWLAKFFLS
jgi:hypothetical protein